MDVYDNPWGGTEGQLYKLIERLVSHDFQPKLTLFVASNYMDSNQFPCQVSELGITKMFSINAVLKMIKFARQLKKNDVRLVHIYFNDASILAPVILKLFGLKVIISRRDMGYWYTKYNLLALNINRYFVDLVIANSRSVQLITEKKEKYPLEKIKVIYNGFEIDRNTPSGRSGVLRKRLGLGDDDIVIGLVANIRPIKKIDDVIVATSMLKDNNIIVHLVIIGEDQIHDGRSMLTEYTELAHKFNVNENVHFLGSIRGVKPYVDDFDIGIMSSESEGLSNSIIEYMASSIPTVCTRSSGNSELITHDVTGRLYETGDIHDLVDNLLYVIENKEQAALMGVNARNEIEEQYGIDKYVNLHVDTYEALLNI